MNKVEQVLFLIVAVVLVGLSVIPVTAQVATSTVSKAKAKEMGIRVDEDKKPGAPKEIAIPDTRTDKVLLLQEQGKTAELELKALIEKFKASDEWKVIEAKQKAVGEKLVAELTSALKLAGVDEKDFDKYEYHRDSLKFTLKEPDPTPVVKK